MKRISMTIFKIAFYNLNKNYLNNIVTRINKSSNSNCYKIKNLPNNNQMNF